MTWDNGTWNRYARNVRSALVKRDALSGPEPPAVPRGRRQEVERERRAWAAKAQANLRQLARLADQAPDRRQALETFHELRHWYENPARSGRRRQG